MLKKKKQKKILASSDILFYKLRVALKIMSVEDLSLLADIVNTELARKTGDLKEIVNNDNNGKN